MPATKWLVSLAPVNKEPVLHTARPLLVCAPYAGGGAMVYRDYRSLGELVDTYSVRYPGREARLNEAPLDSVDALVAGILTELAPLWRTRPIILFGHSLGASVAFELARAARRLGLPAPLALFVSGRQPPSLPEKDEPIAHLPRAEFLAELRELSGTPPEFFDSEELVDLLLPTLRADFGAAEQYRARSEAPLDCPLFMYCGDGDDYTPEEMRAWSEVSRGPFSPHTFVGNHFFIQNSALVLPTLREDLRKILSERA